MTMDSSDYWEPIIYKTLHEKKVVVKKNPFDDIPSPGDSPLFKRSVGELKGQIADWRATFTNDPGCVHAVEFKDRFELHYDKFDPAKKPIQHLIFDSPAYGALAAAGVIATFALIKTIFKK